MEIGFCVIPRSLRSVEELARIADAGGAGWLGIADSPYLFAEPHAAILVALRATSRIRVGTFVTNPVTRHWSVQAASFRSFAEIAPDRLFMGIAAGDSAVHSVGLAPARPAAVAAYARNVKKHGPPSLEIMVAAGGPKTAALAASYADHVAVGQGASRAASGRLIRAALSATRPPDAAPVGLWMPLILNLVRSDTARAAARAPIKSTLVAFSRQAFDGPYEMRDVPPQLDARLRALYGGYSFEEHSLPGESRNARLLPSGGDLEDFLFERFTVVGTPSSVAERLLEISESIGVTNFVLTIEVPDPAALMTLACDELLPRLPLVTPVTA